MTKVDWKAKAEALQEDAVALRREFHRYPEWGLGEYRTACRIVQILKSYGFSVAYGAEVMDSSALVSRPSEGQTEEWMSRALEEGADPCITQAMKGGLTGVVGTLRGSGEGKTVAFRFDMDCNALDECGEDHRPAQEGFASCHARSMHACGHDGHVAIGLTLARLLAENKDFFCGTVKLIFQPAEEGVRGAAAMVAAGVADDVDVFFSGHIGIHQTENHTLTASVGDFLAVRKYESFFSGKSSHSGLAPQEGRNALLAAAHATLALHALPRHSEGATRVNVGVFTAGGSINAIPDRARIAFEVRGETSQIKDHLCAEAERILRASADLQGVSVKFNILGEGESFDADPLFAQEVVSLAEGSGIYRQVVPYRSFGASEDCTLFLRRVTERGGKGAFLLFGSVLKAIHHHPKFDFDESVLSDSAAFLAVLAQHYTKEGKE